MKITLVVGIILFDTSASMQASITVVQPQTEIIQPSSNDPRRTLSFKAARNRLTRSSFLAFQVVKGFVARIVLHDAEVRTSVKIASAESAVQKAIGQCFYTYFFLIKNSEESDPWTQLKG